ncbi:MAG TPA: SDR family oxidoreductase [Mycobacterium sp.]|nr:SDR family oxidoreductase [Mycobacterium sp.]
MSQHPADHLAGKVVVVTGAAGGFGKLITAKCAARGANVVGIDVDAANLTAVFDGIQAHGFTGTHQVADVTDLEQMKAAVRHAVERFGAVDVIVNNAGVMPLAYFADHELAWQKWHRAIDINIKGVLNGITAVYDQMIKQGRGQVVNISSIYGNAGIEGAGVYSATKAAVTALSDSLRVEAKGKIKVTTVKPTGVLGTNLGSWIVNTKAVRGIVGRWADGYTEAVRAFFDGTLPAERTDADSVKYWAITPDDLADAVVHVIDQPWGISISDLTVRASAEDYIY